MSTDPEARPADAGFGRTMDHLTAQVLAGIDFTVRQPGQAAQRLLAAAIAVSTAMVAAHFLPELGRRALPAELSWTLFMVTEALAALGLITWRTSPHIGHRMTGLATTLVCLGASVAGMVTAHVTRTLTPEQTALPLAAWWFGWRGWDVGVAVIAVYPLAFVTSLHLLLGGKRHADEQVRDTKPDAERPARSRRTRTTVTAPAAPAVPPVPPTAVPALTAVPAAVTAERPPPVVGDEQGAEAAALGVTLEDAPEGETGEDRTKRLARNRKRLQRARARGAVEQAEPEPTPEPEQPAPGTVLTDTEGRPMLELPEVAPEPEPEQRAVVLAFAGVAHLPEHDGAGQR